MSEEPVQHRRLAVIGDTGSCSPPEARRMASEIMRLRTLVAMLEMDVAKLRKEWSDGLVQLDRR